MFKIYFKTAFRNLSRHKGYSLINISGLAFGLVACWMIALYVADELSYDRFYTNADRIFRVVNYANPEGNNIKLAVTSAPFAPALKAAFPEIDDAVRIDAEGGGVLRVDDKKMKVSDIIFADKSLLQIFSYQFLYGDAGTALDKPGSILITETLADKLFGSAEKAINQPLYFDDKDPNIVTAVIKDIPANSHLRFSAVRPLPSNYSEGWQNMHLYTYLLLKQGANYKELEKKLPGFATRVMPKDMLANNYHMELQPLTSIHLYSNLDYEISPNGNIKRVYMFISIALLILIIAMINYMNLTTARAAARIREIGIRKVVGSGKWQLALMFISESIIVTLIAGLIAISIIKFTLPAFNELTGKHLSILRFGKLNSLLLFGGFSLLTGALSGIYPSLFLSRFRAIPALKGEMGNLGANILFRKSLVVFQFVITVIMITGSFIIYQQLRFALHKDLGFNKDQVLTFHIDDRSVRQQIPALKAQLLQSPLIAGVAAAGNPIGNNDIGANAYNFENSFGGFSANPKIAETLMADADYLKTMEIKLLKGRDFSDAMPTDQNSAALINETLMRELGWKDPIGKRMEFKNYGNTEQRTVIGVLKDFNTYSLQHKVEPMVMIMPTSVPEEDNLYVKIAKGKIAEGLAYLDRIYRGFDKSNPVEYHFLNDNFARQYATEQKQEQIAFAFTVLALLIACLGLFGLSTFIAAQRAKEIGIRKVLGASTQQVVGLLSAEFIKLVFIASVIAMPIAWWLMNKWLQDFAYRIHFSWLVLLAAGIMAMLIALVTVGIRAIRSALANPVKSLRSE